MSRLGDEGFKNLKKRVIILQAYPLPCLQGLRLPVLRMSATFLEFQINL